MAWSFTDIKYGWKVGAGIVLTGATIFIVGNVRERILQRDEAELDLAVAERCLATQYSTNPVLYYVTPPTYVRSWYSNSYETTNVPGDLVTNWFAVLYTNVYTNAIGYRTDRAKAVARDATIKALVPYYADANTVYDGTTNISMLSVTGLWASLSIGDGTNQFTSVPAIGTNPATYGALPWRIYKEDLEERYKVLNALKKMRYTTGYTVTSDYKHAYSLVGASQTEQYARVESGFITNTWSVGTKTINGIGAAYYQRVFYRGEMSRNRGKYTILAFMNTNILMNAVSLFVRIDLPNQDAGLDKYYWDESELGEGKHIEQIYLTNPGIEVFPYSMAAFLNDIEDVVPNAEYSWYDEWIYGWEYTPFIFIDWNFLYCTDKYW